MKRFISLFLIVSILTGCASHPVRSALSSADTFAICKSADVITTAVALGKGGAEANPIMGWVLTNFGWLGFIGVSAALTYAIYQYRDRINDDTMLAANVITCGVAINNAIVINKLSTFGSVR